MMHEREKSGLAVVAMKPTNKAERSAAELGEPRAGAEGNVGQHSTDRARNRATVSQGLERIRLVSPLNTQGGSRMRESRLYGSVRGALRNERPYRDRRGACHPAHRRRDPLAPRNDGLKNPSFLVKHLRKRKYPCRLPNPTTSPSPSMPAACG